MNKNFEPVRGTSDYLPREMSIREYVKSVIIKSYQKYGFMQIGTPILEDVDLLLGSNGGDNLKLIFKVLKRGEKLDLKKANLTEKDIVDIGLRYDLTVPLVRLFCNNQNALPLPFKSIQVDYSFRADRPQKGRARQFIQCDIDILGDPSINAEMDIINTTGKTFLALGFENFVVKINDRRILSALVANAGFSSVDEPEICVCLDKLDKLSVADVQSELVERGFDVVKARVLMESITCIQKQGLNSAVNYGADKCHVEDVKRVIESINQLSKGKYKAIYDVSIVRGQGYYTGMVYEFYLPNFAGACAGGGRYNNMIEKLTGKSVPAVGLGLGFEPTCMLFMEKTKSELCGGSIAVFYKPEDDFVAVLKKVEELGLKTNASAILMKKNFGFQLKTLKENGFSKFIVFGEKEIKEI